jgi:hypothetical protein
MSITNDNQCLTIENERLKQENHRLVSLNIEADYMVQINEQRG